MRLVLHPGDDVPTAYWVTRRLWLLLLRRLQVASEQSGLVVTISGPVKPPPRRPRRDVAVDAIDPQKLEGIRLRAEGDGARLMLVVGEMATGIHLNAPGLQQLEEMVALQAERAGWDPQAAMQRLRANALANAAMSRAGSTKRPE